MASKTTLISKEMPHNGSILQETMDKLRHRPIDLGKKIGVTPICISRYTREKSLLCYVLFNLSKALQSNLFEPIENALQIQSPNIVNSNELVLQQRIADLEKELSIYKEIMKLRG